MPAPSRPPRSRPSAPFLAVALSAALELAGGGARAGEAVAEYQLKAAFLLLVRQFVARPDGESISQICILGDDPFGEAFGAAPAAGVPEVRHLGPSDDPGSCPLLFIARSERARLRSVLEAVRSRPVLTVGDTPGYASQGVILNLFLDENKVRFEVNVDAARRAELTLSPRLTSLARLVREGR
ncbi:MAG TPA: YfiR family protein [Anaeromyxobacter sp.]|nr:YfiR family protein [Anaeromyxobacter sp.]